MRLIHLQLPQKCPNIQKRSTSMLIINSIFFFYVFLLFAQIAWIREIYSKTQKIRNFVWENATINQWLKLTIKAHQLSMGKRHTQYVSIWFDTVSINFISIFFFIILWILFTSKWTFIIMTLKMEWEKEKKIHFMGLMGTSIGMNIIEKLQSID